MYTFESINAVCGRSNIEIEQPVALVFDFVGQHFFDNYPKWEQAVTEFIPLTGQSVFTGAKARQCRFESGRKVESIFEISEFNAMEKLTLSGIDHPYRITYRFHESDSTERTNLEIKFEIMEVENYMRPFVKLIRMAIEEDADNTATNIKNLISA